MNKPLLRRIERTTVNGKMFLYPQVWIEPKVSFQITELARKYSIPDTHIVGMMVEQFVSTNRKLEKARVEFYKENIAVDQ
jgi:hypothetical protein